MGMNRLALVLIMGVALTLAHAQTPITLCKAVEIGMEKNPVRKAALAEERAVQAGIGEARSALFPRISFSEGVTRGDDPVFVFGTKLRQARFTEADFALSTLNTPPPITNFSTRIGGSWTVFDSFTSVLNLRRAHQMKQVASVDVTRGDQELIFRIVDAYFNVLLAAKQAELAERTLRTAEAVTENSRARFESGVVVESDYLSAQVVVAQRRQESIAAKNAVALARAQLNTAMGLPSATLGEPAEALAEKTFPFPLLDEAEATSLAQRPDLKQADLQLEAQQTGVKLAKSSFGPRVNVFGSWEADNRNFAANGSNNWLAGAEVQIDLFTGGQKLAQLKREQAQLERVTAMKQAMIDRVRLEVQKAFYDCDTARQMVDVSRGAVAQAEESLRIARHRYSAGLTTMTELLRAEDAARTIRNAYWQSVYRYQTSYAALQLAMGTLNQQSPLVTQ
jgi:outer membrane protein TolC